MRVIFLIGGIASGKSSVARELERRGAVRIDLDQVSRDVLAPGSSLVGRIADAFGPDLVDAKGTLNRRLLAQRAFASAEETERLEAIELPAIRDELTMRLDLLKKGANVPDLVVVEVPLPDRMGEMLGLADAVVCVSCPRDLRRERAIGRGMDSSDFDRRADRQLTDGQMAALADIVIDNTGDEIALKERTGGLVRRLASA